MREHPREDDRVWDGNRAKGGLQPYGRVILVDREWGEDDGEAMVEFDTVHRGHQFVLLCDGFVNYDCSSPAFKLGWPHTWTYATVGGTSEGSGDIETYDFVEFQGNWSNHEDGDGLWSLG